MSCQQVPRLAEDPYTFTETPVATTYFTSSIQKHTPIKSANQLPNNHLKHLSSSNQANRLTNGTTNGSTSHHRPQHVPIYAKQPVYQQHKLSENCAKVSRVSSAKTAANVPAPIEKRSSDSVSFFANAATIAANAGSHVTSNGNAKHTPQSIASSTTHPPHRQQSIATAKKQHIFNHSSLTNSPATVAVTHKASPPTAPSSSLFVPIQSPHHPKFKSHGGENHRTLSPEREAKSNRLTGNGGTLDASTTTRKANDDVAISASIKKHEFNDLLSHPTPIRPANGIGKGKKYTKAGAAAAAAAATGAFVKPKAEPKQSIGKKLALSGKIQPSNGKRKRSYSQTSHHEALQRIPARQQQQLIGAACTAVIDAKKHKFTTKEKREWHAPDSILFDFSSHHDVANNDEFDAAACAQAFWFRDIPNENLLTREQRLEMKRDNLRRQAFQYAQAQTFRNRRMAKLRLLSVTKALNKFKNGRNKSTPTKCGISTCSNDALALTAYCYLHITLNADQKLFHPCTAKFSDNSQCRVPVFDISHELPLCPEHAWKRDNYNRMAQEQKPKKVVRKKTKAAPIVRTPKRNKKKKKQIDEKIVMPTTLPPPSTPPPMQKQQPKLSPPIDTNLSWNHSILSNASDNMHMIMRSPATMSPSMNHYLSENANMYQFATTVPSLTKLQQQEMFTVCENSSAYESSEDTGVGGLSESELIGAPDGIEIPLGDTRLLEEHVLNNVLNQLPEDAFNDLFEVQQNDHYEPTQKEQDELARALEEVDEQVKSLEQMTGSTDFLDNFLNVDDEILVDGTDICAEVLTTTSVKNDIRGLVHT